MISGLGRAALLVGVLAGTLAGYFWWEAARRVHTPSAPAYRMARGRARALTVLAALGGVVAVGDLETALLRHDFAISYVAQVGSRYLPTLFTVTSLWSALQGSLLLWVLLLCLLAVVVMIRSERAAGELHPWAMAVIVVVIAFFFGLALFAADPFQTLAVAPTGGPGPNPLLQDNALIMVHPPLLYLGYVGMTVPFAFAVAALVTGRTGAAWLAVTRRWTLYAWTALTVAIVLGAWWSYQVLGWGGYWAWDPVENAALLPWLTATALLHSMMVQARQSALRAWNLALAIATFVLVLLGTFLTRSGVVESVHSFTQSNLGPVLLGFLLFVLVGAGTLFVLRADRLGASGGLAPLLSRETAFLGNNLVLAGLALTVLVGTVFPPLAQALTGNQLSVGAPYFDRMAIPLALVLLVLMGVGPLLPWAHASPRALGRRLAVPGFVAAGTLAALGLGGVGNAAALLTFALAAFVLASIGVRVVEGTRAERRRGSRWAVAAAIAHRRRFYAGMLVHVGVVLAAVAIAASSAYTTATQATLVRGERVRLDGYSATLTGLSQRRTPRRQTITAVISLRHSGSPLGSLRPSISDYPNATQAIGSPAIHTTLAGDAYLVVVQVDPQLRWAVIGLSVHPMVDWLWIATGVIALGAIIAAWPTRRRRKPAPAAQAAAALPVAAP
ncbi:MAG: heme lyase CcmF/NrfE family subunit [Mycobacteriales bacterium]